MTDPIAAAAFAWEQKCRDDDRALANATCSSCRFFANHPVDTLGYCRHLEAGGWEEEDMPVLKSICEGTCFKSV
jgi:hypothetical protein